jgi:hypothetical protein
MNEMNLWRKMINDFGSLSQNFLNRIVQSAVNPEKPKPHTMECPIRNIYMTWKRAEEQITAHLVYKYEVSMFFFRDSNVHIKLGWDVLLYIYRRSLLLMILDHQCLLTKLRGIPPWSIGINFLHDVSHNGFSNKTRHMHVTLISSRKMMNHSPLGTRV